MWCNKIQFYVCTRAGMALNKSFGTTFEKVMAEGRNFVSKPVKTIIYFMDFMKYGISFRQLFLPSTGLHLMWGRPQSVRLVSTWPGVLFESNGCAGFHCELSILDVEEVFGWWLNNKFSWERRSLTFLPTRIVKRTKSEDCLRKNVTYKFWNIFAETIVDCKYSIFYFRSIPMHLIPMVIPATANYVPPPGINKLIA